MRKIVNIIVFVVALLVAALSILFVGVYNEDEAMYKQVAIVEESNPAMLLEFLDVTPETLPQYVATYQKVSDTLNAELKAQQLPKDVLYTYISELKDVQEADFEEFIASYPQHADLLFSKLEEKPAYAAGLANVKDFAGLQAYVSTLEKEYAPMREEYLQKKDYVKAVNSIVGRAAVITESVSASKQETQIEEMKDAISHLSLSDRLLNWAVVLCYVLFIFAIALMLGFAAYQMAKNFKTSYKILVVIVAAAVFVFVAYVLSSPELTPSAIKLQHTANEMKWINAGIISCYAVFFGALASIIVTWVINLFKR
ncbi:MAG: hypothetical protein MJZ76_05690 [Bacteroidales bacterium]|nr:hypothetical protein [Bacteroidales bacterium]